MPRWTLVFLAGAVLAGALGLTGLAGGATSLAKVLLFVFVVLFLASLPVAGLRRRGE